MKPDELFSGVLYIAVCAVIFWIAFWSAGVFK